MRCHVMCRGGVASIINLSFNSRGDQSSQKSTFVLFQIKTIIYISQINIQERLNQLVGFYVKKYISQFSAPHTLSHQPPHTWRFFLPSLQNEMMHTHHHVCTYYHHHHYCLVCRRNNFICTLVEGTRDWKFIGQGGRCALDFSVRMFTTRSDRIPYRSIFDV